MTTRTGRTMLTSSDPRYKGGLKPGALTWSTDGQPHSEVFADLTEAERAAGQNFVVRLPSLMMVGHVDYVRIVRMRPLSPVQTELYVEWLFPPAAIAAPGFNPAASVDFQCPLQSNRTRPTELRELVSRAKLRACSMGTFEMTRMLRTSFLAATAIPGSATTFSIR